MSDVSRVAFFDGIADKWDGWNDLPALDRMLAAGLRTLGVGPDETVLDVGCGTGNLTLALLDRLSPAGRVVAVDISPGMVAVARSKITDRRVEWHVADAARLPIESESCDRIFCFSVWPHFDDRASVAAELGRVLRRERCLHVWHLMSRDQVNEIHGSAGEAVRHDILEPVHETARLIAGVGFAIAAAIETPSSYLVTAVKIG